MRVLIDTNIFIDIFHDRTLFVEAAKRVYKLCENGLIDGYVAPITINNIYYLSRKTKHADEIKIFLSNLSSSFAIASLDHDTIKLANSLRIKDYEDALQYAMAMQNGCRMLVTRNGRDFTHDGGVEVVDPEELIERISRT
jgi:predicted nucleic acid-binding protein